MRRCALFTKYFTVIALKGIELHLLRSHSPSNPGNGPAKPLFSVYILSGDPLFGTPSSRKRSSGAARAPLRFFRPRTQPVPLPYLYWSLLIGSICSRLETLHHDALVFCYLETRALAVAYSSEWDQRKACSTLSNSPIEKMCGCQSPSRFWGTAPPTSTLPPYCLTDGPASFRYS